MTSVFTGTLGNTLKRTLNKIVDDPSDNFESSADFTDWCEIMDMEDQYEDDLEIGGPGLAAQKAEGDEIASGTMQEGYKTRYIARTYALKLIVSEEAMEDVKYPEAIKAARRLKKSLYKTADIDATLMLARMANSSYIGGDGLCLSNTAHTMPGGGTFSNKMATAMSPSHTALSVARAQLRKYPGHDGFTEGYNMVRILCPVDQETVWEGILGSSLRPDDGNFAEINVFEKSKSKLKLKPLKFWANTTTNWVIQTDADDQINFRWRRRPASRTWVDNGHTMMSYAITARWARGWSDPRCVLCVEA